MAIEPEVRVVSRRWRTAERVLESLAVLVSVALVLAAVGLYFSLREWGGGQDVDSGRPISQAEVRARDFDTRLERGLASGPVVPRQLASTGVTVLAVTAEADGAARVYYRSTGELHGAQQTLCQVDLVDLTAATPTVVQEQWTCTDPPSAGLVEVLRPRR